MSQKVNSKLIRQQKVMEQQNRSAIVVLVRAGHTTNKTVKLTKLPNATVYRVYKQFKEERKIDGKEHKTRSDSKSNPTFLAGLKRSADANLSTSMIAFAKKRNVVLSSVSRAVNKNLGMTSYVRRRCHLLTAKVKTIRVERCPKFLSFI
ncbi:uncharacterized protein LOC106868207 [Octopus bimaculoides]|uniref:uncharacterized protein LOC106868207 n=1 Tax=Octopus bimaculoides TaxID=37653 RepID=UPI00071CACD8|nr:uncharacterized protein LOC106868207 [Octopus bimaculoides]|eukprot:XP_014768890.1 PREDICTED: uncharacterized protein LOC106868207 [Octopus bimaculoides]